MLFSSTRSSELMSFEDVTISGTCPKGGLYVPDILGSGWPVLSSGHMNAQGHDYRSVAVAVLKAFAGQSRFDIEAAVNEAYRDFRVSDVVQLRDVEDDYTILELFHGPTYAFKDMALQLLGALVGQWTEFASQNAMVITATSGDTGPAAINGLSKNSNVNVVVLFPKGKVSTFQKMQMTTSGRPNVFPIEVEGDFDDCQALVKRCLGDKNFDLGRPVIAANSINIVRLLCQMIYYVWSANVLQRSGHESISYSVPSGNFGNAFSCFMAKRCGAPIDRIVLGTNVNDTLVKRIMHNQHGFDKAHPTVAPAMDVSSPSNYERLVYFVNQESMQESLKYASDPTHRTYHFEQRALSAVQSEFLAFSFDDKQIVECVDKLYVKRHHIVDPHTAIALLAADQASASGVSTPIVSVATASPLKFLDFYTNTSITEEQVLAAEQQPSPAAEPSWVELANDIETLQDYLRSVS